MDEIRVWQAWCRWCKAKSDVVFAAYRPDLPEGWSYRTIGNFGMCGGTTYDTLCPDCTKRNEARNAA